MKSRPQKDQQVKRDIRSLNRRKILALLPDADTVRVNDDEYKDSYIFEFASLHLHNDIYN